MRKPRWTTRTGRRQIALVALVVGAVVFSLSVGVGPAAALPGSQAQQKSAAAAATGSQTGAVGHVTVGHSTKNDVSAPLRSIAKPAVAQAAAKSQPVLALPTHQQAGPTRADPAVQSQPAAPNMPATQLNFNGVPYPGVSCFCAPPDTNGEVGDTQYVQIVNEGLQVFDKTNGNSQLGPVAITSLWSGFGGPCETFGEGDPVVLYDQIAKRWVVTQFAQFPPTIECVAVSTTSDATGSYNRYAFDIGGQFGVNFYDYPKLSVWPDAYYMSFNVFDAAGQNFLGPQPFALDRTAMLAGQPATVVSTGKLTPSDDQLMPADLDGSNLPPAGAPNPFTEIGTSPTWKVWRFHADFANPQNSTFTMAGTLTPDPFTVICNGQANACVPQAGVPDLLDTLGDRSMFRNSYRHFADGHEALVGNMTVQSNGVAGIRWWEINNATSGTPSFVQQSTYQPDDTWRWMGSAAQDAQGDLALGFSASSSTINPQIRYAGRLAGDPANTLAQGEAHLFDGTGSQEFVTRGRWGDYSDLTVDPSDDCTFWYTNEYYQTTSSFNWRTRIGNFKFPNCTSGPSGTLAGTVTDASTHNPIAGAAVDTQFGSTSTDSTGHYSITLPVGSYTINYSRFGYATDTENNVAITDGNTTTVNVALQPSPSVTVSGTITDGSGHGWPLYTRFAVAGDPDGPFFTDPITGQYSIKLPANATYNVTFLSQLTGYQTLSQSVDIGGGDMTHDVSIPVTSDCTAPGYSAGTPCLVVPGGLVSGNVFDLNTGDAINGATVTSNDKPTENAKTFATPDDPNNPDGFYWLFSSLTGSHAFTASASKHSNDTETVNVAADTVVRQDYKLGAGHLTITPTSITSTQVLGSTATKTLSFHNDGTGPAHVKLSERGGKFQILGSQGGNPPLAPPDAGHFSQAMDPPGPTSLINDSGEPDGKTVAAPNSPDWASGAPVPAGLVRYGYAQCADQPDSYYVISGVSNGAIVNTNYRYDATTNSWTTLAPIPTGQEAVTAACLDGRIYVMGGGGTNQMFIYDIASNTWGSGAATPQPIEAAVAGALDGKVYLVGGDSDFTPGNGVYNTVSVYDVASNTWSTGSPMPTGSSNAGGVQVGNFLYVAGGWGNSSPGSNLTETERYDMSSDAWDTGPAFTPAKSDFALAASGAALYSIAGDGNGGGFFDATSSVHRLDLSSWPGGTWEDLGDPLPGARTANQAGFCTTALTGGETWSVGGVDTSFTWHNDAFYRASGEGCGSGDVKWLDESPAEFDVPVGGTVNVTVTLSATTDAGVTQPGTLTAGIALTTNTPQTFDPVPVTVNVTPPNGWGKLAGALSGTDCSGKNAPLKGVVFADGKSYSFTLRTDANGNYAFWAPSAANPITLTASASGWIAQNQKTNIRNGKTTIVNFTLRPVTC